LDWNWVRRIGGEGEKERRREGEKERRREGEKERRRSEAREVRDRNEGLKGEM
jgi:hypothetical protein